MIAFPIALYMAKVASPRGRRLLVIAVLMPLWASYLVKAYAWRGIFAEGGLIDWLGKPFGIQSPGYGLLATAITLAYLWLPYMVLPIFAGLERVPDSLLEASGDLGAGALTTLRRVVLPMAFPAHRGRLDLHVLAVAGRLHRGHRSSAARPSCSATSSTTTSARPTTCRSRPRCRPSRSSSCSSTSPPRGGPAPWTGTPRDRSSTRREDRCGAAALLRVTTAIVLVVVYVPLALVVVNSFNVDRTFAWPPSGFTLHWWKVAAQSQVPGTRCWSASRWRCWRRRSRSCSGRWPGWRCGGPASSAATPSRC